MENDRLTFECERFAAEIEERDKLRIDPQNERTEDQVERQLEQEQERNERREDQDAENNVDFEKFKLLMNTFSDRFK